MESMGERGVCAFPVCALSLSLIPRRSLPHPSPFSYLSAALASTRPWSKVSGAVEAEADGASVTRAVFAGEVVVEERGGGWGAASPAAVARSAVTDSRCGEGASALPRGRASRVRGGVIVIRCEVLVRAEKGWPLVVVAARARRAWRERGGGGRAGTASRTGLG